MMAIPSVTRRDSHAQRAHFQPNNQPATEMSSLTEKVVATLSDEIRRGALRPGDRIPTEVAMMKQLSVSRSVVREAISRLQAAKVVETRHGIGTFVLEPATEKTMQLPAADLSSMLDVMAIIEFRIDVEAASAALAAARRTDQHLKQMRAALERFESELERGSTDTLAHDIEFHLQIARASGNRYFFDVLSQLGRAVSPRTRLGSAEIAELDHIEHLRNVLSEHQMIYRAIERQDPDDARAAMRMHLSNSRERLRRAHELSQASG
ncbi:GntR family transcriptional regulator [Paraburkholderia sp. BL6669N2]|nr:GntR family transcriptional regulator [Paraburkholderia sp. BL6669N2]RKR36960.1 GntR family transcriptional regulator [Paraburkholderia sp. BL17N1]